MKKLSEKITGGIYEYVREDNKEIVYRGSSTHNSLEKIDSWHRKGEKYLKQGKYTYTVFRSNLRRPLGKKVSIRWCVEPFETTHEELLKLEGDKIKEMIDIDQCYLNHDPEPLKTWIKYNGK